MALKGAFQLAQPPSFNSFTILFDFEANVNSKVTIKLVSQNDFDRKRRIFSSQKLSLDSSACNDNNFSSEIFAQV